MSKGYLQEWRKDYAKQDKVKPYRVSVWISGVMAVRCYPTKREAMNFFNGLDSSHRAMVQHFTRMFGAQMIAYRFGRTTS